MSLTREQLQSFITQYIKPNLRQEITGAVLQNTLVTMLQNLVMLTETGSGFVINYSVDGSNWTDQMFLPIGTYKYYRLSADNGDTWTDAIYMPNYVLSLLRDSVPDAGNTLNKLHTRLATAEADIATLEAAWELTPDDVQSLQDIIDLINANPATFEEALFTKLNTSTFNSFLEQYALDLAGKANTGHTHTMAQVSGLVAALAAKADASTVVTTKEQIMALGFYSATEVDELLSELENTLPDVEASASVVRNRANIVAFDGDFTYGGIDIKLGRTEADTVFSGMFSATLLMFMYNHEGTFTPVSIDISGNTSAGVWQKGQAVANATTELFTSVVFAHNATDLYVRVNFNLIDDEAAHIAFVQSYTCHAATVQALMAAQGWTITDPFNSPITVTTDVTATIAQPLSSADLEPSTF